MKGKVTSYRLNEEAYNLVNLLSEFLGIPKSSVVEMGIRKLAQREGFYGLDGIIENPEKGDHDASSD